MIDAAGIVNYARTAPIPYTGPKLSFELFKAPPPRPLADGLSFVLHKLPARTQLSDDSFELLLGGSVDQKDADDNVQVVYRSTPGGTAILRYEKPKGTLHYSSEFVLHSSSPCYFFILPHSLPTDYSRSLGIIY